MTTEHAADDAVQAEVGHMRHAVAARVKNTSLRKVAREVGMSTSGLMKFLAGGSPYSRTLRNLRNWFVRFGALPGEVRIQDAAAALEVLMHDLLPASRPDAAGAVLEAIGRGYEQSGKERPDWMPELLARFQPPAADPAEDASEPQAA